ncbi:hypothetical protein C9419_19010 [Paraburkholderia fungorum]|nr:hypothetical protein C9419_19010 [Paraburkholderia fungorum]
MPLLRVVMLDQANAAMVAHRFDSRFTFAAAAAARWFPPRGDAADMPAWSADFFMQDYNFPVPSGALALRTACCTH